MELGGPEASVGPGSGGRVQRARQWMAAVVGSGYESGGRMPGRRTAAVAEQWLFARRPAD